MYVIILRALGALIDMIVLKAMRAIIIIFHEPFIFYDISFVVKSY